MKRNQRLRVDAALRALYDQVPTLDCKGLCHTSCGIIEASDRERERMNEAGVRLPHMDEFLKMDKAEIKIDCPALAQDRSCSVYAVRPMLCRLWGATDAMPCPYGCRPVDGGPLLTKGEGFELLGESLAVGGHPDGGPQVSGAAIRKAAEAMPEVVGQIVASGKKADAKRAGDHLRTTRREQGQSS